MPTKGDVAATVLVCAAQEGKRVTVVANAGAPYRAEGYVLMFDERDLILLLLKDNGTPLTEPVLILIHRPLITVLHLHTESTYQDEAEDVRGFAEPMIAILLERYDPAA